jgi:chemotaxis response regulator CheB
MKTQHAADDFPVVCVGGSAGGLDAYTRLLQHLPANMGVAIVIVNHLRQAAILPRYTKMPVELIREDYASGPIVCLLSRLSAVCTFLTDSSASSRYRSPEDGPM